MDGIIVKIVATNADTPRGKLADAEILFTAGPLEGLKMLGFGIWEQRESRSRHVTFPARRYTVNGEPRRFVLLRPIDDAAALERIRDLLLHAYVEYEQQVDD